MHLPHNIILIEGFRQLRTVNLQDVFQIERIDDRVGVRFRPEQMLRQIHGQYREYLQQIKLA